MGGRRQGASWCWEGGMHPRPPGPPPPAPYGLHPGPSAFHCPAPAKGLPQPACRGVKFMWPGLEPAVTGPHTHMQTYTGHPYLAVCGYVNLPSCALNCPHILTLTPPNTRGCLQPETPPAQTGAPATPQQLTHTRMHTRIHLCTCRCAHRHALRITNVLLTHLSHTSLDTLSQANTTQK